MATSRKVSSVKLREGRSGVLIGAEWGAAGMVGYVPKPIRAEELFREIETHTQPREAVQPSTTIQRV
jgi:CheY-like chemotaxis protein